MVEFLQYADFLGKLRVRVSASPISPLPSPAGFLLAGIGIGPLFHFWLVVHQHQREAARVCEIRLRVSGVVAFEGDPTPGH